MGEIFVLMSTICFGISNAYWKKVINKVPFYNVIFYRGVISSLLFGGFLLIVNKFNLFPFLLQHNEVFTTRNMGITFFLCYFSGWGLYFFVKSMEKGKVSIVVPLSSINLFSILTALFILHEQWKWIYGLEFIFVIAGSLLLFHTSKKNDTSTNNMSAIFMSLLASFFWGVSYPLFKIPIKTIGILPFSFAVEFCITLFSFNIIILKRRSVSSFAMPKRHLFAKEHFQKKQIVQYFTLAVLVFLGTCFVNMGLKETSIFSFIVLSNFGQIVSILLGYFIYSERLKRNEIIGVSLLFISIIISNFF
jgi:drug/metabolite transporter (DMT)-like permease